MSQVDYDQLGRFIAKRTPSLDRIERLASMSIMFSEQGDDQAALDIDLIIHMMIGVRAIQGRPLTPKWGGMDRAGI